MHYHSEQATIEEDIEKVYDYLGEIAEAKIENAILTYEYGPIVMDTQIDIKGNNKDSNI